MLDRIFPDTLTRCELLEAPRTTICLSDNTLIELQEPLNSIWTNPKLLEDIAIQDGQVCYAAVSPVLRGFEATRDPWMVLSVESISEMYVLVDADKDFLDQIASLLTHIYVGKQKDAIEKTLLRSLAPLSHDLRYAAELRCQFSIIANMQQNSCSWNSRACRPNLTRGKESQDKITCEVGRSQCESATKYHQ